MQLPSTDTQIPLKIQMYMGKHQEQLDHSR